MEADGLSVSEALAETPDNRHPRGAGGLYSEKWSNELAFKIGVYVGRGYSAPAISALPGMPMISNRIAHMANQWGYRAAGGKHSHDVVRFPVSPDTRRAIAIAASERGTTTEALLEALLLTATRDGLWQAILGDQADERSCPVPQRRVPAFQR
jgi:hypothetical protein